MSPRRSLAFDAPAPQSYESIAVSIEQFLASHEDAVLLEDGKVLFDFGAALGTAPGTAKWNVNTGYGHCTLQLWSEERNLVRRVLATEGRGATLRLSTQRSVNERPSCLSFARHASGVYRRSAKPHEAAT